MSLARSLSDGSHRSASKALADRKLREEMGDEAYEKHLAPAEDRTFYIVFALIFVIATVVVFALP
jgi:hypothetical protein